MGFRLDDMNPRTRILLGVGTGFSALAMLTLILLLFSHTITERDQALTSTRQSYAIMLHTRELEVSIDRLDALLSRFVIDGDNSYGGRYIDEFRRGEALIDQLDRETRSRPEQAALMQRLKNRLNVRFAEFNAVANLTYQKQYRDAFHKHFRTGLGVAKSIPKGPPPDIDSIQKLLNAIITNEYKTLEAESRIAAIRNAQSNRYAGFLAVFGLLLILGGSVLGWSEWRAWLLHADEERRNEVLEAKVAERTQELSDANARLTSEMADRATAEAQLRQVQKMDAIGQLTGGIAHDFNNMLAVVIGGIDMARRRVGSLIPDALRYLDQAHDGATRASALTRQLLAFARGEPLVPRLIEVNPLLDNVVALLDRTLGESIRIQVIKEQGLLPVYVDAHQLENALLNLAVNARDAMPRGGELTFTTGARVIGDQAIEGLGAGNYTVIAVADTGTGMDSATLERAFEPFFTTKPVGRGSGLGLSQIFGFVRQSGGAVSIRSHLGEGTIVSIYLPGRAGVVETQPAPALTRPSEDARRNRGLVVLVIEDDPRVLLSTTDALNELGHVALACAEPIKVATILTEHPQIDLVLCDVMMPGITGPDLIGALRPAFPDLPVLFVTGFAGTPDGIGFGGSEVLRKPFTIQVLNEAIERTMIRAEH